MFARTASVAAPLGGAARLGCHHYTVRLLLPPTRIQHKCVVPYVTDRQHRPIELHKGDFSRTVAIVTPSMPISASSHAVRGDVRSEGCYWAVL